MVRRSVPGFYRCWVTYCLIVNSVSTEEVFKSVPVTVTTYENDTVLLPCHVLGPDRESKQRVRWYNDSELLGDSADPNYLLPPRVRMHANYSLQIDRLQPEDTARYVCEVIRPDPLGPIRQTHSIEVQYSPRIRITPEDGFLEVNKGENVEIGCKASGYPEPAIHWRKNGIDMSMMPQREKIRFKAEHRRLSGVYQCVAINGVGEPVTAAITVQILDAPAVRVEQSIVHTAVGMRASFKAVLEYTVPAAKTSWYRDGTPVRQDNRVVIMVQDNINQLIFRKVWASDFGNYTFRAENNLGMTDVSFKLTGIPKAASFKVDAHLNKATSTSFTLIWEVDSYSTIIEYNLWLRSYHGHVSESDFVGTNTEPNSNLWRKIIVPGDSTDGPIHSARYTVRGLTPSTVYEAIVASRNRFGWSKLSAVLHFATESGTGRQPSTVDYSEVTPLLDEPEPDPEEALNITQAYVVGRAASTHPVAIPYVALLIFMLYIRAL